MANGSLLSKYYDILKKELKEQHGDFVYRGQENADWQLRSGAVRRIFPRRNTIELQNLIGRYKGNFHEDNLYYHERELLEKARLRGWHRETDGRELKDLELLAKLQHYGAATCLLDFTSRFDVALWFACQKARGRDKDGMVFIVALDSVDTWNLGRIGSNNLDHEINKILRFETTEKKEDQPQLFRDTRLKFWYWHPESFMARMSIQESRFLFGSEDIPMKEYLFNVRIEKEDKKELLVELKRNHGLSRESIFPDIHGFAAIQSHKVSFQGENIEHSWQADVKKSRKKIRQKNIEDYLQEGVRKIQMEEYSSAIDTFNEIIKLASDHTEAYRLRFMAYMMLEEYGNARSDLEVLQDLYRKHRNQEGKRFVKEQMQALNRRIHGHGDFPGF
ncbi:MAG: FRG domain-containing protein [Hyphomicrobiales bacterium]|nr:FRG domain-containing protein [Hyphomicrobiales bacterium]